MAQEWIDRVLTSLDRKLEKGIPQARSHTDIPYSTVNGQWLYQPVTSWVSGFWPALMWQMYLETGKALYREEAIRTEELMDGALQDFEALSHDVGFMWLPVSGVRYALEGESESLRRVKLAGLILASRFNPNGFLRAWNDDPSKGDRTGWAIIDCMMNLPILYTMSKLTGDPRFTLMASTHAKTAAKHFVRADGSCRHIVCFDPLTGEFKAAPAGQGYAEESCWTRGASWAIYGFALSYLYTRDPLFLETSRKTADFFLAHLPEDHIAPIDFVQPAQPDYRDESACAIAASGMLELAAILKESDPEAAAHYHQQAEVLLKALVERADPSDNFPALLTGCSSKYHGGSIGITMNYGDFYLVEALRKLKGETRLFWKPLDFAKA